MPRTAPFLPRPLATALLVLLAAVVVSTCTSCVSARNEDGTLAMRFSRLADEAEVASLAKRVDGVEDSLATERRERTEADVAIRTDVKAADDAAAVAFQTAIAQGKTAAEAMAAASASAAAEADQRSRDALARAAAAAKVAEDARQARDATDSGIVGKLGIEEIIAILLGGGVAGTAGVRVLRGAPLRSQHATAASATASKTPAVPAS